MLRPLLSSAGGVGSSVADADGKGVRCGICRQSDHAICILLNIALFVVYSVAVAGMVQRPQPLVRMMAGFVCSNTGLGRGLLCNGAPLPNPFTIAHRRRRFHVVGIHLFVFAVSYCSLFRSRCSLRCRRSSVDHSVTTAPPPAYAVAPASSGG